jgi:hypothetical protein
MAYFEEFTFVETAKEFNAMASENSIPLHQNHHEQVATAVKDFHEKIQQEIEPKLQWQNGKYRKIDSIFCEILSQKKNIIKSKRCFYH